MEELMNVRVTLVSRTPQQITEAPSAIQVISGDDLRRSGATNLPDALRLIPNVQVAQYHAGAWIVGVRGFNTLFANKLLVMLDGRTVYTPLFGGVIWDLQHLLLEDVERIEVVSGPGGTLWGANAVNGVINIITRKTKDTQGTYISATGGNFIRDKFEARHSGKLGEKSYYKVYGMHSDFRPTYTSEDLKFNDDWNVTQGGFRMDFEPTRKDEIRVQGDVYRGFRGDGQDKSKLNGQNINASWSKFISSKSDMMLQVYLDRYYREDVPTKLVDEMTTVDADFQHRLSVHQKHSLLWGVGYRYVRDNFTSNNVLFGILPPKKNLDLATAFLQDHISVSEKIRLTVGTKVLHNVYTGVEWQPGVRLSYLVNSKSSLWAAVSRAVRTPSRFDRDYFIPGFRVPDTVPSISGGPNFISEKVLAYEVGYRLQPSPLSTLSLSLFYNSYTDIYSVEQVPGTATYQIMNNTDGRSYGFEAAAAWQATPLWKLRGGYSYIHGDLHARPGHNFDPAYLATDAKHRLKIHSMLNLPHNFQFDITARFLSGLDSSAATKDVPAYFTFDSRLAWVPKIFEVAFVLQNAAQRRHREYGDLHIPRNFYVKLAARF